MKSLKDLVREESELWAMSVPVFRGQERVSRTGPQGRGETEKEVTQSQVERGFHEGKRLPLHPIPPTC